MKKLLVAAVALIFMMTGSVVIAADNTLTVQATVTGTCKFVTGTSTLNFGTLDQGLATDPTGTASPTFWCTKGSTYTATTGQGLNYSVKNRMSSLSTTDFIPYTLGLAPATGSGSGKTTPITLTVTGTILNADYVNVAAAANYTDTVVITITP